MRKYILLCALLTALPIITQAKDSLHIGRNLSMSLYSGMLPRVKAYQYNVKQALNLSYGIALSYASPLKKNSPLSISWSLDAESGVQKYSSSSIKQRFPENETRNEMVFANTGVGMSYLYALKKNHFLSMGLHVYVSCFHITKRYWLAYDPVTLDRQEYTHYDDLHLQRYNFAIPLCPEVAYVYTTEKIGYKVAGGAKLLTQSGSVGAYSRVLPYITLGFVFY